MRVSSILQKRLMIIAWTILIAGSVALRIPSLGDQASWWRAIQTEMTSYWFQKEGIDLLNYQTPLYGPPWQIPFEFPLFQASTALIAKVWPATGPGTIPTNISISGRLVAMLSFYLSALFVYLICKTIFLDEIITFITLAIYLYTPYNIRFSMEPLIDFLALALALGYFYFILRFFHIRQSALNAFTAIIFGCLGILVKPTTMPVVAIPIAALTVKDLHGKGYFSKITDLPGTWKRIWTNGPYWLALGILAVVPLLAAYIWTRHADHIKTASIFTAWLSSGSIPMKEWNYGTWEIRTDPIIWIGSVYHTARFLSPYSLSIFAIFSVIRIRQSATQDRIFLIASIASSLLTLAIFLNLFKHSYYYVVFSAWMAIVTGYGIYHFWQLVRMQKPSILPLVCAALVISSIVGFYDYLRLRSQTGNANQIISQARTWAQEIKQHIPPDDWAIVIEEDWDPTLPYLLERKTMVITLRERDKPICSIISDTHFKVVVSLRETPDTERTLACFRSYKEVMPGVYKVSY